MDSGTSEQTWTQWRKSAQRRLAQTHQDADYVSRILDRVLVYVLREPLLWLYARPRLRLQTRQWHRLEEVLSRLLSGEPWPYVSGEKSFWGRLYQVAPSVLIPREDSELLVQEMSAILNGRPLPAPRVLELGLGCGHLSLSLALSAEGPGWRFFGLERSVKALRIAKENARRLAPGQAFEFVQGDWRQLPKKICIHAPYGLVFSNPPYLSECEWHAADASLRFEPKMALVAAEEGQADLRYVIGLGRQLLGMGGWLVLEHGATQGHWVRNLFQALGYTQVFTRRDLSGLERVSGACWSGPQ